MSNQVFLRIDVGMFTDGETTIPIFNGSENLGKIKISKTGLTYLPRKGKVWGEEIPYPALAATSDIVRAVQQKTGKSKSPIKRKTVKKKRKGVTKK